MNANSICIDYDATYSYSHNSEHVKIKDSILSITEVEETDSDEISFADNYDFKNLSINKNNNLNIVIPNRLYEDRKVYYHFVNEFFKSDSEVNLNILSQAEALAFYLICNNYENGRYRVTDIGEQLIKVHNFEIKNSKFCHINTKEFRWKSRRTIEGIFEENEDQFFISKSPEKQKKILDQIHEDLIKIDPKYHIYRINYDSTTKYQHIKKAVESWSEEFNEIINKTSIKDYEKELYCGKLATWKTFMKNVSNNANLENETLIEWKNVIKVIDSKINIYGKLKNAITFYLTDINGQYDVSLFEKGDRLPISQTERNISDPTLLKNIRIQSEKREYSNIELQYNGTKHSKKLELDSLKKNAICIKSNSFYEWVETRLEWEIDGCNNLNLNFYQTSNLIHSQKIANLKLF